MSKPPKKTVVNVVQDAADPVTVDVLAKSVVAISDGVSKLRRSGLTDDVVLLLIQHAAPAKAGRLVPLKTIKAVLDGMESLKSVCLRDWKRG